MAVTGGPPTNAGSGVDLTSIQTKDMPVNTFGIPSALWDAAIAATPRDPNAPGGYALAVANEAKKLWRHDAKEAGLSPRKFGEELGQTTHANPHQQAVKVVSKASLIHGISTGVQDTTTDNTTSEAAREKSAISELIEARDLTSAEDTAMNSIGVHGNRREFHQFIQHNLELYGHDKDLATFGASASIALAGKDASLEQKNKAAEKIAKTVHENPELKTEMKAAKQSNDPAKIEAAAGKLFDIIKPGAPENERQEFMKNTADHNKKLGKVVDKVEKFGQKHHGQTADDVIEEKKHGPGMSAYSARKENHKHASMTPPLEGTPSTPDSNLAATNADKKAASTSPTAAKKTTGAAVATPGHNLNFSPSGPSASI